MFLVYTIICFLFPMFKKNSRSFLSTERAHALFPVMADDTEVDISQIQNEEVIRCVWYLHTLLHGFSLMK